MGVGDEEDGDDVYFSHILNYIRRNGFGRSTLNLVTDYSNPMHFFPDECEKLPPDYFRVCEIDLTGLNYQQRENAFFCMATSHMAGIYRTASDRVYDRGKPDKGEITRRIENSVVFVFKCIRFTEI